MEYPRYVGKHSDKYSQLKQEYFVTEDGLFIPSPVAFFGDTFRVPAEISFFSECIEKFPLERMKKTYNGIIREGKEVIDEILSIADPLHAYGLVQTSHNGHFLAETHDFFNTKNLQTLYDLLLKDQYDFEKKQKTQAFHQLDSCWQQMLNQYLEFYERNVVDDVIPITSVKILFNE